ncbi:MAG: histidine phosphatase family protein [Candidatus Latescibacteria bacterium]|jgi:2,3-bisphosphoglycerate-dependent phosphoglycerate mutase|nr:histidine phosphatase family protein [Candidatus Latescibacterota bacterium]MBT4138306.1 histidine phosphatase family protein [Candidatus Latescibacterota bacterium]
MELYLIRHGQSQNNAWGDSGHRVADPTLTEAGHEQAKRVADHVRNADQVDIDAGKGYGIDRLFCSAMLRTLQTTAPIAQALGVPAEIWLDWHEEGGIWLDTEEGEVGFSGLTRDEIEAQFPGYKIPDEVTADGWWNRPRETVDEMAVRAKRVVKVLEEQFVEQDIRMACVTHGAFANVLIQTLVSGGLLPGIYFGHYNTGISRIDFVDMMRPRFLNRVEHLPVDLRT